MPRLSVPSYRLHKPSGQVTLPPDPSPPVELIADLLDALKRRVNSADQQL